MAKQPMLPSIYSLPWDTKRPMFPTVRASSAPAARRSKPRPIKLQLSMFGEQVDSRRMSPVSVVFAQPQRINSDAKPRLVTPRADFRAQRAAEVFSTPSPLTYSLVPSIGPQPLSPFFTASRVSLRQHEDRWEPQDRLRRINATPAPNAYFPR